MSIPRAILARLRNLLRLTPATKPFVVARVAQPSFAGGVMWRGYRPHTRNGTMRPRVLRHVRARLRANDVSGTQLLWLMHRDPTCWTRVTAIELTL